MGTRGLTGFVVNNSVKAAYQQYDSYPEGVGTDVLEYCQVLANPLLRDIAAHKAANLIEVDEQDKVPADLLKRFEEQGLFENPNNLSTANVDYYWGLHKCQGLPGKILDSGYIAQHADFGQDSLFCEWAYLINFDDGTLEVYKGYQTEPHTGGRWSDIVKNPDWTPSYVGDEFYYGVRLVKTFSLDSLPTDAEAFVAEVHLAIAAQEVAA